MTLPDRCSEPGRVVVHLPRAGANPVGHEIQTQRALAREVATLLGLPFHEEWEAGADEALRPYFVPGETLDAATARGLGVLDQGDLFGGVVPAGFVGTKVIGHPLVEPGAVAPAGWSPAFAERVRGVTLPGYSAFCARDARLAGQRLLGRGSVRVKLATGVGGVGQSVVRNGGELDALLGELEDAGAFDAGVVLERNLEQIDTYSIGHVRVGRFEACYYGRQRLTENNRGLSVYGGSDLILVRGGFEALLARRISDHQRMALEQARTWHMAALHAYPGLLTSRCNYDVARGVDEYGQTHCGVLEQSWRVGGASGAELAALHAFREQPELQVVHASTTEIYGTIPVLPADARVYYAGEDKRVGRLTKYAHISGFDDDADDDQGHDRHA